MRIRRSLVLLTALLSTTAILAARPGKGIIATSLVGDDLTNVTRLLSLPSGQQVHGLRNAALHHATALQRGIESLAEEDTTKMEYIEIQDLAAFIFSTEASLAELQQQSATLEFQELQVALTQCSQALATTESILKASDLSSA